MSLKKKRKTISQRRSTSNARLCAVSGQAKAHLKGASLNKFIAKLS